MSENTEYGMIDVDLDGYVAPEIVTDTNPYTLKVVQIEPRDLEVKGQARKVIDVLLRIMDSGLVNPKPVRYTIWLPSPTDTPEQKNSAQGKIIRFKQAVGDDSKGLNVAGAIGAEFQATLKVKRDENYGDSNEIKRILV